ncbi:GAF domain-containing sensor histidine kinase [Segnochrobactrum spirostomi]|uniref:GAF domain-containing sensor histidine kinase n=1 Tax=Segnochrobactrum spirostomi TaxID=2608987 RepID=A0A6A7YCM0_9HYPH|nr:GAF domain-containing sensor histidine kinase [Segnochrobactrum spirostomi]MQT15442.1 GAF domain-containing sensor histidine kinase [Segnochrobactrum spirostomi]
MVERPSIRPEDMLSHVLAISRAIAGQTEFQPVIHAVSREIAQILPHDHLDVCILVVDQEVVAAYETGLHTRWGAWHEHPVAARFSPIRSVLWGEVPFILTEDALTDERFQFEGAFNHPIFDERLRSRLHVPLRVQGTVFGALSASTHVAGFYTLSDIGVAQHVADLLAPYFHALRISEQAHRSAVIEAEARAREEGLRESAQKLTEALERERQRIGMDLHDETLADLTRLARRLEQLGDRGHVSGEAIKTVAGELQSSIRGLRRIIDDARPNVLQLFGFVEGIENLLENSVRDAGLAIATGIRDTTGGRIDRLAEPLKVALFRIVQEAVNNAVHHGRPSEIKVELSLVADHIRIAVIDNGIGLSDAVGKRVSGINNMRTRARLVSAAFSIEQNHRGGTTVVVDLPAGAAPLAQVSQAASA